MSDSEDLYELRKKLEMAEAKLFTRDAQVAILAARLDKWTSAERKVEHRHGKNRMMRIEWAKGPKGE